MLCKYFESPIMAFTTKPFLFLSLLSPNQCKPSINNCSDLRFPWRWQTTENGFNLRNRSWTIQQTRPACTGNPLLMKPLLATILEPFPRTSGHRIFFAECPRCLIHSLTPTKSHSAPPRLLRLSSRPRPQQCARPTTPPAILVTR